MKKQKVNYSFDFKIFCDLPYEKYEANFTFIVDGKRYQTSRIKADILSPFIRNAHFTDETMNEFTINTNDKSDNTDYFNNFLNIVNSPKLKLDFLHQIHFAEYFYLLGNFDESIRLRSNITNDLTINNAVDRLLYLIDKYECFHFDIDNEKSPITKIVDFIASHFEDIDRETLKKLPIEIIEDIFQSESLNIYDYDSISTFILELFELNNEFSPLFEYIPFDKISDGVLDWFLEVFDIKYINKSIWNSLNILIKYLIKQKKDLNENRYLNLNKANYMRHNYFLSESNRLSESDHTIPNRRINYESDRLSEQNTDNNELHDYDNEENDDEYNDHVNEEEENNDHENNDDEYNDEGNEEEENNDLENNDDEYNDQGNEEEDNNDHANEEEDNNDHANEEEDNNDHANEEDNNDKGNEEEDNNDHANEEDNNDIYENINDNNEYNNHENDDEILIYTDENDGEYKNDNQEQKNESGEAHNYDINFDKSNKYIDPDSDDDDNNNDNNFTYDKTNSFNDKEIHSMNLRDIILLEYQNKNAPPEWTFQKKYQVLYAIAIELETINKHRIPHKIVKPELIYLNENYEPQFQSLNIDDDEKDEYYEKDNVFLAPEILDDMDANEKRDVYSFAINAYYMFTGRCPFDGMDVKIFVEYVKNNNRDVIPENIHNLIRSLIENCWKTDPDSRFSFLEIIDFMKNAAQSIDEIDTEEFHSYIKKFDESEDANEED